MSICGLFTIGVAGDVNLIETKLAGCKLDLIHRPLSDVQKWTLALGSLSPDTDTPPPCLLDQEEYKTQFLAPFFLLALVVLLGSSPVLLFLGP